MGEEKYQILTNDQLLSIFESAWSCSSSTRQVVDVHELKTSDYDTLSSDIEIALSPYLDILGPSFKVPTGEAFFKLLKKGISQKTRSHYILVLFILIKKGWINNEERKLMPDFFKHRNHFLQLYLIGPDDIKNELNETKKWDNPAKFALNGESIPHGSTLGKKKLKQLQLYLLSWLLLPLGVLIGYFLFRPQRYKVDQHIETNDERINLSYHESHAPDGPPTNVEFLYDVQGLKYKEAFIDFGTDRTTHIYRLPGSKGKFWETFTNPVIGTIQFYVDGKYRPFLLKVNSKDWFVLMNKFYVADELIHQDGVLHFPLDEVPATLLTNGEFYVNYEIIRDFDFDIDDLTFETRIKNPQSEGGISCYDGSVRLIGQLSDHKASNFTFNLLSVGCERYARILTGNTLITIEDTTQDMRQSTINMSEWVVVKAVTHDHNLKIFFNDTLRYDLPYQGVSGELKFVQLGFKGTGSVDWVRISPHNGTPEYFEDFVRKK